MTILTKSICNKWQPLATSNTDGRYTIELYDAISDVEEQWSLVSTAHDIFYSIPFLRCLEMYPATGIKPYYGVVKDKNMAVGIIYFQSKYVSLKENLRKPGKEPKSNLARLIQPLRHAVVHSINFQTIICGNLLLTGKYGFYFKDVVSHDEQFYLVIKASEQLTELLMKNDVKPGLVLIKDFFTQDKPNTGEYHQGFTQFTVQPKMLLDIRPEWYTFDDYLEDMKSKYRIRARKALQKASDIKRIIFNEEDIAQHRSTIHTLYKNISDQADFNAFVLHDRYFENLKAALGQNMTFTTYWRNDRMVAFFTSIKNFDILDAHFLGYDPTENNECQLYLNMLYDLISEGIEKKVAQVDMSRTAVEIKSTVGAIPNEMYLYLRHNNTLINKTVGAVLNLIKPEADYVIRSPFRDE
ncbi:MAG: GNAT family N-acetyltransferase [Saprospiraceae bacterium]|nr:GNAT family N-acetyltransferase [Saprospiraceae bacterium]MBL0099587.1 GNAT family N-acetyltransferase [Saprospiraceae bacterium]